MVLKKLRRGFYVINITNTGTFSGKDPDLDLGKVSHRADLAEVADQRVRCGDEAAEVAVDWKV